jgi:hypothetical protein
MSGVLLLILMMATAFIGYVLPWGQMSFWTFFHFSLSPAPTIGGVWPPIGIEILNLWEIPLLNTILLLSSGATVTWAHHSIVAGDRKQSLWFSYTFLNIIKYWYGIITKGKSIFYHPKLYIENQAFYFGGIRIPTFLDFADCSLLSNLITPTYNLADLDECAESIQTCFPIKSQYHTIFKFLHYLVINDLLNDFLKFFGKNNTLYEIHNVLYLDIFSSDFVTFVVTQLKFYDFEAQDECQDIFWEKVCPKYFSQKNKKETKIFFHVLYKDNQLENFFEIWSK